MSLDKTHLQQLEEKLLMSANIIIDERISRYTQMLQKTSLKQIEQLIQIRVREMKAVLKTELIKQTQDISNAQIKEFEARFKQNNVKEPEKKKTKAKSPIEITTLEKVDQLVAAIEEITNKTTRNTQIAQNIQKLTYERLDDIKKRFMINDQEIKDYKGYIMKQVQGLKGELLKLKLSKNQKNEPNFNITHLSQLVTRTELQKLYYNHLANGINNLRDDFEVIKFQMLKASENRKFTHNLTEGIDKIEYFINSTLIANEEKSLSLISQTLATLDTRMQKQQSDFLNNFSTKIQQIDKRYIRLQKLLLEINQKYTDESTYLKTQVEKLNHFYDHTKSTSDQKSINKYNFSKVAQEITAKLEEFQNVYNLNLNQLLKEIENAKNNPVFKDEMHQLWTATQIIESKLGLLKQENQQIMHLNRKSWVTIDQTQQIHDNILSKSRSITQQKLKTMYKKSFPLKSTALITGKQGSQNLIIKNSTQRRNQRILLMNDSLSKLPQIKERN